jgi:adenosine deaminase
LSLADFVRAMPKVELHVHLEGSILPETLLALAQRRGVSLPAVDSKSLAEWFRFRDFEHFVEIYLTCSRCLRAPEDFQRIALDFLAAQAAQNVVYTEAHFTIGTHLGNGLPGAEVREALWEAVREGEERHGVRLRWIPDIVRNVPHWADATLEWALDGVDEGVVALGLSGSEARFSSEPFRDHFLEAGRRRLHRVAHAGEHAGPEVIEAVLDRLGAERIGHGVRAADSDVLMKELAEWRIPLEVCPTSNVCLGVAKDIASHPFDRLRRAGLAVTANSDDPALFNTDITHEYLKLAEAFHYEAEDLAQLALGALSHAFLPDAPKRTLEAEMRQQFRDLGERHLGRAIEVG